MDTDELIAKWRAKDATKKMPSVDIAGIGKVYVRKLLVSEVDAQANEPDTKTRLARAAVQMLCDENGKRYFDANNPEHMKFLGEREWDDVSPILAAANDLVVKAADPGN